MYPSTEINSVTEGIMYLHVQIFVLSFFACAQLFSSLYSNQSNNHNFRDEFTPKEF